MPVHKDCGEYITWATRPDDETRFYPPLESIGHILIIMDGQAVETIGYKIHRCDPQKMEAWIEYLDKIGKLRGEITPTIAHKAASDRNAESMRSDAENVECPQCKQPAGQPCINMTVVKKSGEMVPTKYPHMSRRDFAYAEESK